MLGLQTSSDSSSWLSLGYLSIHKELLAAGFPFEDNEYIPNLQLLADRSWKGARRASEDHDRREY